MPNLDLILHSPAAARKPPRRSFFISGPSRQSRVIVPHMAMSAATMIACAADEIIMGNHSFIGLIDPQLQLQTALGGRLVPAQAIIDQFELAKSQTADPAQLRAWLPMLSQYGPDPLVTCSNATKLAMKLVREWLTLFMFNGAPDAAQRAESIDNGSRPYTLHDARASDI